MKLVIAFVFLGAGGWFFVDNLLGEFGSTNRDQDSLAAQEQADEEDLGEITAGTESVDLLAVVGSCDLITPV
ncbi:MAG: hypothetical protein ACYTG5_04995, partial [Planctomycetota bacterium]